MVDPQPTAPDLPNGTNFPPDLLAKALAPVKITPTVEGVLRYQLLLPRGWVLLDRPQVSLNDLAPHRPLVLGLHMGPVVEGGPPFAQIMALGLEREINAADWLRHYAVVSGYEIHTLGEVHSGRADALVSLSVRDERYAARLLVTIVGGRLILALLAVPGRHYEALAELLGVMTASFVTPDEDPDMMIEGLQTVMVGQSAQALLPVSWLPSPLPEGIALSWANAAGQAQGVLHLSQGPINQDNLQAILGPQAKRGALLADRPPEMDAGPFSQGHHRIYSVTGMDGQAGAQELWELALQTPQHHISLLMLTPSPAHGFSAWAINRRALDIVLQTLELG